MSIHKRLSELQEAEFTFPDPGDAGVIASRENWAHFELVTAAAETRTVSAPTKPGQHLVLSMVTDGGDCTVTVTGGYDETGGTVLTFANVGEAIELHSVCVLKSSGTRSFAWRVAWNDGVVGPVLADDVSFGDEVDLNFGAPDVAVRWDTSDANSNQLHVQMPAGTAVNVPVIVVGQSINDVDLGLYNGVVDPRVALLGVGAVTTGPGIDFRKARGTAAAPTVVTSGDDVGTIRGYAAVAAGEYVQTAEIRMDCAGTIATTRGPGTITFLTATDAAPSVLTAAMTISAAQNVTMATATTTGNHTFSSTITAGADGVGADGEQLTSGGAAAECDWSAAGSMRQFKNILGIRTDADEVLKKIVETPIYDFQYRSKKDAKEGERIVSTGDVQTVYTGIMADEAPWAMHFGGKILNPINTIGHLMLAIKALTAKVEALEAAH